MTVLTGDCLEVMPTLDAESIDAVVCDPPYGLSFMGKAWDHGVPGAPFWTEALRVAKPGAHLVAFGGTRTFHRLTCAIEDAGWEIRDCLSWLYGSGFPKSHNGAWGGTALKPAWEPIVLARKPLGGTVAANYIEHGTGALNIDGCRIASDADYHELRVTQGGRDGGGFDIGSSDATRNTTFRPASGRWPANVCLDEDAAEALDAQSGELTTGTYTIRKDHAAMGYGGGNGSERHVTGDSGGASRFFYTAKASRAEREAGLEDHRQHVNVDLTSGDRNRENARAGANRNGPKKAANVHPTVKPLDLMQWLCRLVTPKGGLILDPFTGSGTTGRAAVAEGFRFIGIELSEEYATIARARIAEYAPLFSDGAA